MSESKEAAPVFTPVSQVLIGDQEKKQRSLKYSVVDGSFYSVMAGFGESFFSAFAIFLNATSGQLALLGSLPQMIGSISQLFTRRLIRLFGNRQKFIVFSAIMQGLMHLPILAAYFFGTLSATMLLIAASLYWFFGMILGPAWNSWMGDLVDENVRGSYFGKRNFICGFASFASFLTAGYLLQFYTDSLGEKFLGFAFIFIIAICARLASAYFLSTMYEPAYEMPKVNPFPFKEFLKAVRTTNFGTFVSFIWVLNFGVFLSGPFFAPYMLTELGLTYMQYTFINAAAIIAKLIFMPVWGKASDKFGTRKLMFLSAWLVVFVPITWLFADSVWYLIVIQLYSGFAWAGFDITTFNFLFDTTQPSKRASAIAYHNVINGLMLLAGALLGGVLVKYGWIPGISVYLGVFLASGLIRLFACIFFLLRIKEVRTFEKIGYRRLLLRELTVLPTMGLIQGAVHSTSKTKNRVKNMISDIDDFIENIAPKQLNHMFVEIDEFFDRHVWHKKRILKKEETVIEVLSHIIIPPHDPLEDDVAKSGSDIVKVDEKEFDEELKK